MMYRIVHMRVERDGFSKDATFTTKAQSKGTAKDAAWTAAREAGYTVLSLDVRGPYVHSAGVRYGLYAASPANYTMPTRGNPSERKRVHFVPQSRTHTTVIRDFDLNADGAYEAIEDYAYKMSTGSDGVTVDIKIDGERIGSKTASKKDVQAWKLTGDKSLVTMRKNPDTRRNPPKAPRAFVQAYIECALWSSTDDDGDPLDESFDIRDVNDEDRSNIEDECASFYAAAKDLLEADGIDDAQAGRDYWLTRNGHGAGFWDRGNPHGDELADMARADGTRDFYIADDGRLNYSG